MINPFPNDKILDWSKFKAFADDKSKVAQMMNFVLDRVENIVGKDENAGFSFYPFPTMLLKPVLLRVI